MSLSLEFPKGPITKIKGTCLCLEGNDIDTDRIIPARFLKCVSFKSLGDQVFADDRKEKNGLHPFDIKANQEASILLVEKNFGCGSSREHAPQALMRWGIRAIIGYSFAEIFHGNCISIGIPCLTLEEYNLTCLQQITKEKAGKNCSINMRKREIVYEESKFIFSIDKGAEAMFKSGNWDATSTLISQLEKIKDIKAKIPYINNFES